MSERDKRLRPAVFRSSDLQELVLGPLKVRELLTREHSPEMSVALIELDGNNEAVRNTHSHAAYFVLKGSGTFTIGKGERLDVYEVNEGDLVFIPKGTLYQDSGKMTLVSFCTPAFDPEQVERASG